MELNKVIQQNFKDYAAETILRRAIIDVKDGLKPSARQVFYALHTDKITHKNKPVSTVKAIGSGFRFYVHGDSSLEGIIYRAGQPFSYRYPLIHIKGQFGSLKEQGKYASPRYTKTNLSEIASYMFTNIEKDTIDKWYDNYDNTEKYPSVLPCLGFWPLVEGSMGIGVSLSSSVPALNLREMNTALIECLWDRPFDIPMPDFATGAQLINAKEVKESLLKGTGSAAKMRAVINYDQKNHQLIVTEIPPLTYTCKIAEELEEMLQDPTCGFDRFLDTTGETPRIIIFLTKSAQPEQVIQRLYRETSLQNTYSINMTMLHNGRPQVFGLIEAMKIHLEHEISCYTKAFEYDLRKLEDRLHIVEGYITACAHIEEVIKVIKASKSSKDAQNALTSNFNLTDIQAAAVLKLTLSRIASLEVEKFINEKNQLIKEIERISLILNDNNLLKKEVEKGLREVMVKFGDARRTKIIDITDENSSRLIYITKTGKASLTKPKNETILTTLLIGTPYLCVTRKGIVYRSDEIPSRAKTVFIIDKDDEILTVQPAHEEDFLVTYSTEKNFRCTQIKSLNKKRTTLTTGNIADAYVTNQRISKSEYKRK